jgi:eukaryotic-like serine/threonine-protein kinase
MTARRPADVRISRGFPYPVLKLFMKYPKEINEALFEVAAEIGDPESRQVLLDLIRHGDPSQAESLENLLDAHTKAESFFRKAEDARTEVAVEAGETLIDLGDPGSLTGGTAADEGPGQCIDRYRLEKRIGEGGCGVVYLAEQLEPVRRQVALKVIRLGMDTERVIARFEMERQALAMMDHPNIARVLDAGATEKGRPYFVMEWVRGSRITDFCDKERLDLRHRINLFTEVCKGIQHAHQKGVIHRDIKPSNILIAEENGKPAPKVIDFGVAKAISDDFGTGTAVTLHDQFVGTPAYMSPEQADLKQQDIDTRSDVYSLGILLYELLVGRTPFDAKELNEAGLTAMRAIIVEREPATPSATLASLTPDALRETADSRQTDTTRLVAAVRGDLDSVVMKAIEKDRSLRYGTVNGLIMDLQRYVAHEPVIARPRSRTYLFGKFVRRNRLAVGAAVAIVTSLVLGLGAASAFYLRERRAKQEQSRLREFAEAARAREQQRLAEAREWESFAQVSMLLSEGKTEEADQKLRETPVSAIRLSSPSFDILRSMGNWNALRGRWQQAAESFMMLVNADELNPEESLAKSLDLIMIGSALAESGNSDDYRIFRGWALGRFAHSSEVNDGQRLLHSLLFFPVEAASLNRLGPVKEMMEAPSYVPENYSKGRERELAIWNLFGLALMEYRQGNYQKSLDRANQALTFNVRRDYILAAIEPVHAMAAYRLGNKTAAREDLERTRKRLANAFTPDLPAAYEPFGKYQGYWWDWIAARILFREAEAMMQNQAGG